MEKMPEPKEIVNEMLGQDGILYLRIKWRSTWLPFQCAVKICGNEMVNQFHEAHGLGEYAKPASPTTPVSLSSLQSTETTSITTIKPSVSNAIPAVDTPTPETMCLTNEEVSPTNEIQTSKDISVKNDDKITPESKNCSSKKKSKRVSRFSSRDTANREVDCDFVLPKRKHLLLYQKDKIIPNDVISQFELNKKPFKENGESNPIKTKQPLQNSKKSRQNSTSVLTFENDIMQKESSLPMNITSDTGVNLLLNIIPHPKLVDAGTAEKLLDSSSAQKQLKYSPNQKLVESDYLTNNLENPLETTDVKVKKNRPKSQILKDSNKLDNNNAADKHKTKGQRNVDTCSISLSALQHSDQSIILIDNQLSDEQHNKEINNPFSKLIGNEKNTTRNDAGMSSRYVTRHISHKNTKENHIDNIVSNDESSLVKQKPNKRVRNESCLSESQISVAESDEEKRWLYEDNVMMLSSTRRGREFKGLCKKTNEYLPIDQFKNDVDFHVAQEVIIIDDDTQRDTYYGKEFKVGVLEPLQELCANAVERGFHLNGLI